MWGQSGLVGIPPRSWEAAEGWPHFTCSDIDPGQRGFGRGGAAAPVGCGVSPSGPHSPHQGTPKHPESRAVSCGCATQENLTLNDTKTPSLNSMFTNFVTCTNANKPLNNLSLELYWEGEISVCTQPVHSCCGGTCTTAGAGQRPPGVNNSTACSRGEGFILLKVTGLFTVSVLGVPTSERWGTVGDHCRAG